MVGTVLYRSRRVDTVWRKWALCCCLMLSFNVSPKAPPILFKERRSESLCPATLSQVGLAGVGQFRGAPGLYWIVGAQSVGFVRADLIRER